MAPVDDFNNMLKKYGKIIPKKEQNVAKYVVFKPKVGMKSTWKLLKAKNLGASKARNPPQPPDFLLAAGVFGALFGQDTFPPRDLTGLGVCWFIPNHFPSFGCIIRNKTH